MRLPLKSTKTPKIHIFPPKAEYNESMSPGKRSYKRDYSPQNYQDMVIYDASPRIHSPYMVSNLPKTSNSVPRLYKEANNNKTLEILQPVLFNKKRPSVINTRH